jgi:uroporphyrinogen decarboxylase
MHFRQDRLSSDERMEALFRYEKPDRVPINMVTIGFPCRNGGLKVAAGYSEPETFFQALFWTGEQYGWDLIPSTCPHIVMGAVDFGGKMRLPEGEYEGGLVITDNPVHSPEDIETLAMPDPENLERLKPAMAFSRLQKEHGLPISFVSRSPFTVASNICGLSQFSKWMIKKPELCERLIKMAFDHTFNVLSLWIREFGTDDFIFLMSSPCESNQVISPKQFEKFALPWHHQFHEKLRDLGIQRFWFHICGEQNKNLPMYAEAMPWAHPSILSFGHEVDLESAAGHFPEDIIFGNIEPAVIQTGTPRDVYDLAVTAIEKGKKAPGGFVLSAGCELPVATPPINLYAITKAVHDTGWYE